jgi:pimeloyl-ACP methyl ester carboxylesterase
LPAIETGTVMVDGVSTFFRRVPGEGDPVVFVHGNPSSSSDWQPFLERMTGPALALDLPGWGHSELPDPEEFDYSMTGLARFVHASCSGWRSSVTRSSSTTGVRSP